MSNHYPAYPHHAPAQIDPSQAGQGAYVSYPQYGYRQSDAGAYGPAQPGHYPGYQPSQWSYQARPSTSFLSFPNDRFIKGLLIGAAATYLVTNESVQRTLIKGAVKTWALLQAGVEEVKERFHDADAELRHRGEPAGEQQED